MFRYLSCVAMLSALAACAVPEPKEPPLEGIISISAGPCLGLCPEFTMRVEPDDRYSLNAGANTIREGRSTGGLPVGSFRRALDGTPTLTILRKTDTDQKVVSYEVGCLDFEEKDRMDQMIAGLYRAFRINDLVAVGEPPKVEDKNDTAF